MAAGEAPPLSFRARNIFAEAVDGTFNLGASFLATCSYHVALAGLLSHCPTLLLAENDYYRQKAAGLSGAFKTRELATVATADDVEPVVDALLDQGTNKPLGSGSYDMWLGQAEKALRLSRLCLDMDRAAASNQLELTAGAFREVAANLGELRKRRILEERLAQELAQQTAFSISIPARGGLSRYVTKSYWSKRRQAWLRSIKKRINKWD
jgi:hypothetical protein